MEPDEDSTAKASVLTPPSARLIHEVGAVHEALEPDSGRTYASYPGRIVSSLSCVHSPIKEPDATGKQF